MQRATPLRESLDQVTVEAFFIAVTGVMNKQQLDEIINCLPRGRTVFPYFRDRYAALLLSWLYGDGTSIAEVKSSRHNSLLDREVVRTILAACGDGRLDKQSLALAWQYPHEDFLLTLDRWGGDSLRWQQTTRHGFNLVLQVNLHEGYRRWFDKAVPEDEKWVFNNCCHPVLQKNRRAFYRPTLGWIRMDLDFDTGEVLLEEIQSDWIRDLRTLQGWHKPSEDNASATVLAYCNAMQRRLGKIWDEALMAAALWFVREELGLHSIWYHTFESGCRLKRIVEDKPPRSLYTRLPRKFCFQQTSQQPMFLQTDRYYRRCSSGKPAPRWFHLQL
jgi:hypothetical protein